MATLADRRGFLLPDPNGLGYTNDSTEDSRRAHPYRTHGASDLSNGEAGFSLTVRDARLKKRGWGRPRGCGQVRGDLAGGVSARRSRCSLGRRQRADRCREMQGEG